MLEYLLDQISAIIEIDRHASLLEFADKQVQVFRSKGCTVHGYNWNSFSTELFSQAVPEPVWINSPKQSYTL
jgi:hypothetical protein